MGVKINLIKIYKIEVAREWFSFHFFRNFLFRQITTTTKGNETNVHNLQINSLEEQIEQLTTDEKVAYGHWVRQEKQIMSLSQQRASQLEQLGLLTKQIMIMEQKNHKLEYELEKQGNEETNVNRKINELQQSLSQKNAQLASKKQLKDGLESKYFLAKDDYGLLLKEAERELKRLQIEIQEIEQQKLALKQQVVNIQWENLAWKNKVEF